MTKRHDRRRHLRDEAKRRGVPPGNETERWVRLKLAKLEAKDTAELRRIFGQAPVEHSGAPTHGSTTHPPRVERQP